MSEGRPTGRFAAALRFLVGPGLAFGALALLADELERLPGDIEVALSQGLAAPLLEARWQRAACGAAVVMVQLLALAAWAARRLPQGTEPPQAIAGRGGHSPVIAMASWPPSRFLAVLLVAGSAGLAALAVIQVALAGAWPVRADEVRALPWRTMLRGWATLSMWSVLWGWLFFRHLQQRVDHRRLVMARARHATLARDIAETRLRRARAQIDPSAIARVLRSVADRARDRVHDGTGTAADPAIALLDALSGYLRLLLQRVRRDAPTVASDLALLHALAHLQSARDGAPVRVVADAGVGPHGDQPSGAFFPVARALLEALRTGASARAPLQLDVAPAQDGRGLVLSASVPAATAVPADDVVVARAFADHLADLPAGFVPILERQCHGRRLVAPVRFP